VTPGAGRLFNVLPTDLGRPLGQIRVKLDVPDLTALVQAVIETVTPRDVEVRADDGRWYSLRIRPYRTAEHRITGAVLALVDVDELRRTAAARDYARAIIETVREPLVVLDANLNVREVNAAFYRTFHVGSSETTGRLIYELGNGEWDIPALRRLLEDVLPQHVQLTDFEVDHTFPHIGRRVMRLNASRIVGPELILLAIEDVTEHHVEVRDVSAAHMNALERERLARQDAEAASRAKDTFLATLSHELRTPLTSMLAWVRMLRSGRLDEAVTTRALESIERNTRAQAELIEDLLDVSRITSGKLRLDMLPLDLAAVIQTAIETLRPAAEAKSIRLDATLAPARGAVLGDRERLQQVVWNLVSNAVKFTPRGGRVEVTLAWEDHRARLTVQDTGMGIKPTLLPSIFERFRQGEDSSTRTFGGLGIGLAIVRHIVELHGGTVTAESAGEGQGATFTVAIPFAPAAARPRDLTDLKPAVVRELHADPAMLDGIRVMLVEDDRDAREVVAAVLTHHGAVVSAVSSASEALEVLHDVRPDVLVSDIGMPGQDGYALMRAVRALPAGDGGRVAAIALTAYARADDSRQALDAGFQMHLSKPVDPGMLAFTVARLHRERTEG
jgi:two-component system CheB/CheR fusion protein